jgi:hypothetical protein
MTLTPFLILILAGYAVFIGVLGVVSIWSNGGARRSAGAQVKPAQATPAGTSATVST